MFSRRRSRVLIDRTPQHLPLPLGSLSAVHHRLRPLLRVQGWWRVRAPALLTGVGLLSASAGGALVAIRPAVAVGLVPRGVELGGQTLRAEGAGAYGGGTAPALVLRSAGGGVITAAGDGTGDDGLRLRGRCELRRQGPIAREWCTFMVGTRRYQAEDILDSAGDAGWQRRYSDGQRVVIPIPRGGALTPVPFPVGKP